MAAQNSSSLLFLSTLSLRRATHGYCAFGHAVDISIHALLAESDRSARLLVQLLNTFLSTLSLRRATVIQRYPPPRRDISIHALLAESDRSCGGMGRHWRIFLSTLSLRRATRCSAMYNLCTRHFYPRSPCGERLVTPHRCATIPAFLSTLSLRRATLRRVAATSARAAFLSTLSLRRATEYIGVQRFDHNISIHALLAESDGL